MSQITQPSTVLFLCGNDGVFCDVVYMIGCLVFWSTMSTPSSFSKKNVSWCSNVDILLQLSWYRIPTRPCSSRSTCSPVPTCRTSCTYWLYEVRQVLVYQHGEPARQNRCVLSFTVYQLVLFPKHKPDNKRKHLSNMHVYVTSGYFLLLPGVFIQKRTVNCSYLSCYI